MRNDRELLTDDVLRERKEVLLRIIDGIDELLDNKKTSMSKEFKNRDLDYIRTRRVLLHLSNCDTSQISTKISVAKAVENEIVFEPEEAVCFEVFGVGKKEWSIVKLPKDYKESVSEVMKTALTERERTVLMLRYGFGGEKKTLDECAHFFDAVRETIRQTQHRALRKLRKHPYVDILSYGLEEFKRRTELAEAEHQKKRTPDAKCWEKILDNPKESLNSFLFLPIEELNISARAHNSLRRNSMYYLFDVFVRTQSELSSLSGVGIHSYHEILDSLRPFAQACRVSLQDIQAFCRNVIIDNNIPYHLRQSQATELIKLWAEEKYSEIA